MKKVAYIGSLGMIGIISTEFGVIGILPQLASHYSISIETAGLLLSAFALVIAVTGPFMTLFASGFDRKKIMMLSIAMFLITGIVSSFAPPFWLLVLVRMIPAFLQPVYISTAIAAAVAGADKGKEHQMMGIVMSGIAISTVSTIPLATYLASIFDWQASFMVQAVVSGLALIGIYKVLPSMPVYEKKTYGSQLGILKNSRFLISTAMNFFMISAWFSTYSYFADYLGKAKLMDTSTISYMMFLFGVTGVIANWISGKMLGKSVAGTTAFFLSGTLLIPILLHFSGGNNWATIAVVGLWGFLHAPSFLNASAYMISAAPKSLEFANSLATSSGNMGVTMGTVVSGWVIASYGVQETPWVGFCFGILALSMIAWRKALDLK